MKPLAGIKVLTLEQAAALPFATRHLADLGADVYRVQSHVRSADVLQDVCYYRGKRTVGLDLSRPEGPQVFRDLAAGCDVVAHNFTQRVVRKFGIDFAAISRVNPRLVYASVTGFGTTGPFRDRPLFGPGAEAMSGQNAMMGEPGALTPGRPGTVTYADHVCGLYLLFGILAALERRDRVGAPQLVDASLYESGAAHVGAVIAERSAGARAPRPTGTPPLAEPIADVADVTGDERRWRRGAFVRFRDGVTSAPVWGGGATQTWAAATIGEHNEEALRILAGYDDGRIAALVAGSVVGQAPLTLGIRPDRDPKTSIQRGLIERVDAAHDRWKAFADVRPRSPVADAGPATGARAAPARVLEIAGSVAVAYAAKQFADVGWEVVRYEHETAAAPAYRWGDGRGGTLAYLNYGKRIVTDAAAARPGDFDIVIGAADARSLPAGRVAAALTGFGVADERTWSDATLQAASGFMSLTGEFDQPPQQLPPFAAELTGAVGCASAILAAYMESLSDGRRKTLDLALVDVLGGFAQSQVARYAQTGEVARREGRVKHALRMVPASDGFVYCAPGAVMNVDMRGVAELVDEPRLAEARFQTAEARMRNWNDYVTLMVDAFARKTAREWFEAAEALHLTFALVQTVDDMLVCPQLAARDALVAHGPFRFPRSGFKLLRAPADG